MKCDADILSPAETRGNQSRHDMTMTERWPHRGDEIQVYDLTPEEVRRQNRKDNRTRRRAIIRCTIKRWLRMK